MFLLFGWLGGVAVNEVSRLVEEGRANNELLAGQEGAAAARAVVAERLRLARDLHDAIGHSLTVVALQAEAARRLAKTDPLRAAEVMRTVASAARSGVAAIADDDASGDFAELVDRVRATGMTVDTDLVDEAMLAPDQRAVAFRVVQEGLTNALRHAPGSHVTVSVRRRDDSVAVTVANSTPTASGTARGSGRGLAGIRERVAASAGRVVWRSRADGGFELCALLPVSHHAGAAAT
jgi:signal transduction histidine kinase